jgi:hypothetical protein
MGMSKYYIFTDGEQYDEFEAENLADALDQIDVPSHVTDARSFEAWLESCGGYGVIYEDDTCLANVKG